LDRVSPTASAALLATACGEVDYPGTWSGRGGKGGNAGTGVPGCPSGGSGGEPSSTAAFDLCSDKETIVTIPGKTTTGSNQACMGSIAKTRSVSAPCARNNADPTGYLRTRAFDSTFDSTKSTSVTLGGGSVGICSGGKWIESDTIHLGDEMLAFSEDLSLLPRWLYNAGDARCDAPEFASRSTQTRSPMDGVWRRDSCSFGLVPDRQSGTGRASETGNIGVPFLGRRCGRMPHGRTDRSGRRGHSWAPGLFRRVMRHPGARGYASA